MKKRNQYRGLGTSNNGTTYKVSGGQASEPGTSADVHRRRNTLRDGEQFPKKRNPPARDGHSSLIYQNKMYIFGGDRNCMPFNDLSCLPLRK